MQFSLEDYLKNPCYYSPLPYWKAKVFKTPDDLLEVHDRDFDDSLLDSYVDRRYFRLIHNMNDVVKQQCADIDIVTATDSDISTIVKIINESYIDIKVTQDQICGYRKTAVFDKELWIIAKDKLTAEPLGCAIADFDKGICELIIEWIQVLPVYRGKGIAKALVKELLLKKNKVAKFATVSGDMDNATNPLELYRACGFVGNDIWHILRRRWD